MKRTILKHVATLLLTATLLFSALSAGFAWFADMSEKDVNISGSSISNYFAGGDGSASNPYLITEPIHLYNLAWLQYIGYFNLNSNGNNGRAQSSFKLDPESGTLDMNRWVLPPIGTTQYPFIGNFFGNNCTISNLTTANALTTINEIPSVANFSDDLLAEFDKASGVEVGEQIGFFGVIGNYGNEAQNVIDRAKDQDINIGISDEKNEETVRTEILSAMGASSFGLLDCTVKDSSTVGTTVGIVAGHLQTNLSGITVNGCSVNVLNSAVGLEGAGSNLSDYTLVGYCPDHKTYSSEIYDVTIYSPTYTENLDANGAGNIPEWGESVAMKDIYTYLDGVRSEKYAFSGYAYRATKVQSQNGDSFFAVIESPDDISRYMYADKDKSDKIQYSIVYADDDQLTVDDFMMLAGGAMITKTYVCEETSTPVNAFYITYDGKYLNIELGGGEPDLELGTERDSATKWVIDSGALFALTKGVKLYVHASGSMLDFNYTPSSGWSYETDSFDADNNPVKAKGLCYTDSSNQRYYLKLIEGVWQLREAENNESYYLIHKGDAYLAVGNILYNTIYNVATSNEAGAAHWYIDSFDNPELKDMRSVHTEIGSVPNYALAMQGYNFVLDTAAFGSVYWKYENNRLELYTNRDTSVGFLAYDGNNWSLSTDEDYIATVSPFVPVSIETHEWKQIDAGNNVYDMSITEKNTSGTYEFGVANDDDATFIPLQKATQDEDFDPAEDDPNAPARVNTGYITGGMYNQLSADKSPDPNTGDVRASAFHYSNVQTPDKVYVCVGGEISQVGLNDSVTGLEKFESSVSSYESLLNDASGRLYGMQFIDGMISEDSLITIPHAVVNNWDGYDYEVPADCINFELSYDGYINFFAGTYYPGTNCFFSLHHVIRRSYDSTKIDEIKEISVIYENPDTSAKAEPYVYEYTDGTFSVDNFDSNGATEVFNTSWIKSPNSNCTFTSETQKSIVTPNSNIGVTPDNISTLKGEVYYFEIPVNAGEYALGSVSGGTGACLLYLDIGTSPTGDIPKVERTIVTEYIVEKESGTSFDYVDGVSVGDNGNVSVVLGSGYIGEIALSRVEDNIIYTPGDIANVTVGGASQELTVNGNSVPGTSYEHSPYIIKRVTITDISGGYTTTMVLTRYGESDSISLTCTTDDPNGKTITESTVSGVTTLTGTDVNNDTINWSEITETTPAITYTFSVTGEVSTEWVCTRTETGWCYDITVTLTDGEYIEQKNPAEIEGFVANIVYTTSSP